MRVYRALGATREELRSVSLEYEASILSEEGLAILS